MVVWSNSGKSAIGIAPSPAAPHTTCDVILLTVERDQQKTQCKHLEEQLVTQQCAYHIHLFNARKVLWLIIMDCQVRRTLMPFLSLCSTTTSDTNCGWTVKVLPLADQLLIILMKLRCNFSSPDLSVRFDVSTATVTNVTRTFIKLLHEIIFEGMW